MREGTSTTVVTVAEERRSTVCTNNSGRSEEICTYFIVVAEVFREGVVAVTRKERKVEKVVIIIATC